MELIKSKNAQLLNDLNDKSLAYPYQAIKAILCQAEATILNQEKEIESLRAKLSAMRSSKPVAYRQQIEVTKNGITTKDYGYSDIQIMEGDDALYLAAPSIQWNTEGEN